MVIQVLEKNLSSLHDMLHAHIFEFYGGDLWINASWGRRYHVPAGWWVSILANGDISAWMHRYGPWREVGLGPGSGIL